MQLDSPALTASLLGAAVVVLWALFALSKRLFGRAVLRAASATRTSIDDLVVDLLRRTGLFAAIFIVLWAAPSVLVIPARWHGPMRIVAILALTTQLVLWTRGSVRFMTRRNQVLLEGIVRNHSRMRERRVSFILTLHHATRTTTLADVEELVRGVVSRTPQARFERAKLKQAHAIGFDFEIVYYVGSEDYDVYTSAHHLIMLGVLRELEARGIALATQLFASTDAIPPAPE